MNVLSWWHRLRFLVRRDAATRELEEEMRLHLEARAAAHRAAGREIADASATARRGFGNTVSLAERSRDAWGLRWLDDAATDFRFAVRRLSQHRGFGAGVAVVLALGIGATTAMFSAVDATMLRPLPFAEPERLLQLERIYVPSADVPYDRDADVPRSVDLGDIRAMSDVFQQAAAYASGGVNLSDPDRPLRLRAGVVTANFFSTLGVAPFLGRTFSREEGASGGPAAVVISEDLWQREYGARDIGSLTLSLGGRSYPVVGVMPAGFGFPDRSDVWLPLPIPRTTAAFELFRGYVPLFVVARIADGISVDAARRRLLAEWERLARSRDSTRRYNAEGALAWVRERGVGASLQTALLGDRRTALLVLLAATGLLLLIACANVANLMLAQATSRQRELAMRTVLGASRGRLFRQLLAESLLLSIGGAILGVATAPAVLGTVRALVPEGLAAVSTATLDRRVLAFAALLAVGTGLVVGLWPALGAAPRDCGNAVRAGGDRGATAGGAGRARRLLVGVELALSGALLVGAGLMLRSFDRLMRVPSGFDPRHTAVMQISFLRHSDSGPAARATIDRVLERLADMPGIEAAGAISELPLSVGSGMAVAVAVPGAPRGRPGTLPVTRELEASADYFRAMGIALRRGRTFIAADTAGPIRVAVVNEAMQRRFWPGRDPIGRTFREFGDTIDITVVGVVADVREFNLSQEAMPQAYLPIHERALRNVAFVARSSLRPAAMLATLRASLQAVDPALPPYGVRMMADVVGASVAPRRTNTLLITGFAALALLLAGLGVYAVVSYSVAQRARELGIRAALGARNGDLIILVLRDILWVSVLGVMSGLLVAWAGSRAMTSMLFGIGIHDLATFAVAPIALLLPAVVATVLPVRAVLRVRPTDVMRAE